MKLTIRSWFIARWLGVTDKPADGDYLWIDVPDIGRNLWWKVV